ncbi:unnamed protein product [Calypogeia fissa]
MVFCLCVYLFLPAGPVSVQVLFGRGIVQSGEDNSFTLLLPWSDGDITTYGRRSTVHDGRTGQVWPGPGRDWPDRVGLGDRAAGWVTGLRADLIKEQLCTALLFLWLAEKGTLGLAPACAVSMYSIFIFVVRGARCGTGQTGRADRLGQDGQDGQRGPVFVRGPVPEGEQTGRRRTTRRRNSSSAGAPSIL